jgi:hypothetical protein
VGDPAGKSGGNGWEDSFGPLSGGGTELGLKVETWALKGFCAGGAFVLLNSDGRRRIGERSGFGRFDGGAGKIGCPGGEASFACVSGNA